MYKILANTLFLGKDIIYMTECHSTNDIAFEKIKERSIWEGGVVITDNQTLGKGQRGNQWLSSPGRNLTFSVVFQPVFLPTEKQFYLSMAVSLAVADVLGGLIPEVSVKWPNDIVLESGEKLGGILIENTLNGKSWEYAVVGIGININQTHFGDLRATSVSAVLGKEIDRVIIWEQLMIQLEQRYIQLREGKLEKIRTSYLQTLFRYMKWAGFDDGEIFEGKITDLDPHGRLIVEKHSGESRSYGLKEIRFL
jgi:BirA family transcriptional regulator, biotin operon repressor / biotin---[acetyl-CoA-carboxylase] ligase